MTSTLDSPSKPAVVMVAYHFPPQTGSSGALRTLKFSRYLPDLGWQPVIVTAEPRAYESIDARALKSLPGNLPIYRAFALDTKRHLSFRGAYPDLLALPDRWVTWALGGVPTTLRAIRKHRAEILFTTFPICSAVLIGLMVHRLTGIPWILDLRDSMTEDAYPRDPRVRRVWRWIERHAVHRVVRVIFTTPSARRMYLDRYKDLAPEKCLVISNGYDEEDFADLPVRPIVPVPAGKPLRLLHTGTLYPEERDPKPFFNAVAQLKRTGVINASSLAIDFRAPGWEDFYTKIIGELQIADIVRLLPALPYKEALRDAVESDALVLFQAANCDHQIPAKAYEYLRLGKPILALTTTVGDTGVMLQQARGTTIVDLADQVAIAGALPAFLNSVRDGEHATPEPKAVALHSRKEQARQLAEVLTEIAKNKTAPQ